MSNREVFKSLLKDIKEVLIEDAIEKYNQQGEGLNHFKEMYSRLKNYYEDNSNINDILNTVKLTLIDFDKSVKINQYCEEDIKIISIDKDSGCAVLEVSEEDIKLVHNQFKKILEFIAIIEKSNRLLISNQVIEKEHIISFCKRLEKVIDDSNKFKLEI